MMDRIVIWSAVRWLVAECCGALQGLGVEVVGVESWSQLTKELASCRISLLLLISPLRGRALRDLVERLRCEAPGVELFVLWWDQSEEGAVERLMAGVNQIYTLPCCVERLRRGVARALLRARIGALEQN